MWIIINDKVYDVTNYDDHDGGFDVFMDYAGKDATVGFEGKDENDHNHSKKAIKKREKICIGYLVKENKKSQIKQKKEGIITPLNVLILLIAICLGVISIYILNL